MPRAVTVIGAGGHAKVVISTLLDAGYCVDAIVDDDPAKWGTTLMDVPIGCGLAGLSGRSGRNAVVAVGENAVREWITERFTTLEWVTVVHPRAYVHPSVRLGLGTVVFAGAVLQPGSVVGAHVIINTGATVDHDCQVADYVHLAPGTHLAGGVRIERGAFLGIGSAVVPGCRIGEWSTIGAGGVVVRDLPKGITAIGVPARPIGEANGAQRVVDVLR